MESDADLTRLPALYGGTGCGGVSFSLTVTHRLRMAGHNSDQRKTKTKMQKLAADGVVATELRSLHHEAGLRGETHD